MTKAEDQLLSYQRENMTIDASHQAILAWAKDRGILDSGTPQSQMLKVTEEVGELAGAIAKNRRDEIADALGDVFVTLALVAELADFDLPACVRNAYRVIAARKGRMVDGVFVKEELA